MAELIKLRIILEDDARKLIVPAGVSHSFEQLVQEIKTNFGEQQDFRLENYFANLTAISEINHK